LRARPQTSDDLPRLLRRLDESVRESWFHGTRTVLLLDDADQALADTLTQVARLAQSEMASQGKLHLLLAAGTTQVHRLGARLLDLVDLRVDLEAWEQEDTVGYLQHTLVAAGRERPVFDEQALYE